MRILLRSNGFHTNRNSRNATGIQVLNTGNTSFDRYSHHPIRLHNRNINVEFPTGSWTPVDQSYLMVKQAVLSKSIDSPNSQPAYSSCYAWMLLASPKRALGPRVAKPIEISWLVKRWKQTIVPLTFTRISQENCEYLWYFVSAAIIAISTTPLETLEKNTLELDKFPALTALPL